MAKFNLGNPEDRALVENTLRASTMPSATDDSLFVFGRYQNPRQLYNPIRDFLFDPARWDAFAERHCRHAFTAAVWNALPVDQRLAQRNSAPFRVMQFRARRLPSGIFQIGFVTNANPAQHLRVEIMRMCELDAELIAVDLPVDIRSLLIVNALRNIDFTQDFTEKLVIVDLYPDRPVGTQGLFHHDCAHEQPVHINGFENIKYVSLLFLPRTQRLVRGTLLTSARQLVSGAPRTATSLITQTGGTLMFRDSLCMNSANEEIPYMAHATPPPQVVPEEGRVEAMIPRQPGNQFDEQMYIQQRSPLVTRMNAATLTGLEQVEPRAFTRVHICDQERVMAALTTAVHIMEIDIRLANPLPLHIMGDIPITPRVLEGQYFSVDSIADVDNLLQQLARNSTGGKSTKKINQKQPRKRGGGNNNVIVNCSRCNFVELEHVKLVVM